MVHVAHDVATANALSFINRDPTVVQVTPRHVVTTSTGGKKWVTDDPVADETVRMIPARGTTEQQPTRITADGRTVIATWMVMTKPLTNIDIGDIISDGTKRYEIIYRTRVPSWRNVFEAIENSYG